ncbi:MAG: thymidylate synthase [Pseudomonadota bacterium]
MAVLLLPAFLMACGSGSNPFEPDPDPGAPGAGPPGPTTPTGIPDAISGDVTRISLDPVSGNLTVEGLTLDNVPFAATYTPQPNLDRNGYTAFTAQNDALDRHSTSYFGNTNNDGSARAGVTVTGGPRNRFFGGAFYERDGAYTPPPITPTSGLVSYAGNYIGLINIDFNDTGSARNDLIAVPGGTPSELIPGQAVTVEGRVFINTDFADNSIEGNIFNRSVVDGSPSLAANTVLPSLVLINTGIDADGSFSGNVEYEAADFPGDNVIGNPIGDWGGIIGGPNGSGLAGAIRLTEFDGPNDPLGLENEEEFGIFVLDQCGQPVDDAVGCAGAN